MTFLTNSSYRHTCVFFCAAFFIALFSISPARAQIGVDDRSLALSAPEFVDIEHTPAASQLPAETYEKPAAVVPQHRIFPERTAETQLKPVAPVALAQEAERPFANAPRFFPERSADVAPEAPAWKPLERESFTEQPKDVDDPDSDPAGTQNGVSNKFHWKRAIFQSLLIQTVQHGYAVTIQEKTQRELKGPFIKDWLRSVRNLHGWDDGNRFFTNYVAHPMQGGMTGFIYLQNHDRLKRQKFAESKTYWVDRLKAMAWSAAWSTQWEIGPYGQAAIGNVGLKKGMAYVDLVVTPTVGTGWMVIEEALDRYVIRHLEKKSPFVLKIFLRTLLNPMRGVANTLRWKEPWYRDRPFGT